MRRLVCMIGLTAVLFAGTSSGALANGSIIRKVRSTSTTTSTTTTTTTTPTTSTGFVTAAGTGLTLNGQPYRFDGFNIYDVNSNGGCVPKTAPSTALSSIGSGQEAFRAYFYQPWATVNGTRNWSAFDATVAAAASAGQKVIAVLANEWNYCDGPQKYLDWWQTGYKTTTLAGDLTPYRQWVADVVARYAGNPAIAMWDLVNEGEARNADGSCTEATAVTALRSFADDVGGLVHTTDTHHIVTLGTISGECGSNEGDYQTIYASPGVDLCDYHDYGRPTSPMGNTDPYNGLSASIGRCHADGKPIAVLETGIHYTRLSPATLAERALLFDLKLQAQFNAGVVGELMWDWAQSPQAVYDYEIGPGDPSATLVTKY